VEAEAKVEAEAAAKAAPAEAAAVAEEEAEAEAQLDGWLSIFGDKFRSFKGIVAEVGPYGEYRKVPDTWSIDLGSALLHPTTGWGCMAPTGSEVETVHGGGVRLPGQAWPREGVVLSVVRPAVHQRMG
jgi:hypothetical protein